LLRLSHSLRRTPAEADDRPGGEERVRQLLASRVRPCCPALVNSLGIRFNLVPAGSFRMGAAADEARRDSSELPGHRVEISRPFYLGVYPVTQAEDEAVAGTNPSHFARGARWYARGDARDPTGPARGSSRVLRGGSWFSPGSSCRAAYRGSDAPGCHSYIIGFRLACTPRSRA
jgi:formylglycine-generating enzyme required for sulfatase activity